MKIRSAFSLVLVLLMLCACTGSQNEDFIQGTWVLADPNEAYFLWEFNNGGFVREQEIAKDQLNYAIGRYRILDNDEDTLTLELFDLKGDRFTYENNDIEITILIDRDQDTIQISSDIFDRVKP